MADVTNLDDLAGPPKRVVLGGVEYLLPGDIPIDLFIEMADAEQSFDDEEADELAIIKNLRDRVLELFQFHQEDMESLPPGAGFRTVLQLVGAVYRAKGDDEEKPELEAAEEDRPTKATPTRKSPAKRSRSASSS